MRNRASRATILGTIALFVVLALSYCTGDSGTRGAEPRTISDADSSDDAVRDFSVALMEIEAVRQSHIDWMVESEAANPFFYGGVGSSVFGQVFLYGGQVTDSLELPGVSGQLAELTLLQAPAELQPVKDALVTAYLLEFQTAVEHGECENWVLRSGALNGVECGHNIRPLVPAVSKDNIAEAMMLPPGIGSVSGRLKSGLWGTAQVIREAAYTRWREVLDKHGIADNALAGVR